MPEICSVHISVYITVNMRRLWELTESSYPAVSPSSS